MANKAAKQKIKQPQPVRSISHSIPENHGILGCELRLGKKSHVYVNKPGRRIEYFVPTVEVLIGIGNDHTAILLMDTDAWKALGEGKKVNIDTLQKYQNMFINPRKKKTV